MPDILIPFLPLIPTYVLAFFRVAGLMLFAPMFGSTRVPRRMKIMIALVMACAMVTTPGMPHAAVPEDMMSLAVAIAGEMLLGIALGMIVSLTFVAAQWAGEMIGQQVGFNLAQALDPQFGGGGTVIGDMYFMLTMCVFLVIGGHRVMVDGIHQSLQQVPPGALVFTPRTFDVVLEFMTTSTTLSLRLAAPIFVTMLVVDVALGCLGKVVPHFNVMATGMSLRSALGIVLLILGMAVTAQVIETSLGDSLLDLPVFWKT